MVFVSKSTQRHRFKINRLVWLIRLLLCNSRVLLTIKMIVIKMLFVSNKHRQTDRQTDRRTDRHTAKNIHYLIFH